MEAVALQNEQNPHVWSVDQIGLASALGGPMAGCYLLGRNYRLVGHASYATRCYVWGLIVSFVFFTALVLLPEALLERIPNSLIPMGCSAIFFGIASSRQKKEIANFIEEGGKRYSFFWWLLVVLSLVVIQLPIIFLYSAVLVGTLL